MLISSSKLIISLLISVAVFNCLNSAHMQDEMQIFHSSSKVKSVSKLHTTRGFKNSFLADNILLRSCDLNCGMLVASV
jgi:hypothetical protein